MKKKLLAVVKLDKNVDEFAAKYFEVLRPEDLSADNAKEIEVIMSNGKGVVSKELLDRLPEAKLIDNFGAGYDGVDTAECARRGIALCTTPGVLTDDVADLALAFILNVSRRITHAHNYVCAGKWKTCGKVPLATSVSGKNIGIIGLGRIGSAVARRAEAFAMQVCYFDTRVNNVRYLKKDSLTALAQCSDYLVVCAAAARENRGLISLEVLKALGPQGYLINVARGSLVDEEALAYCLEHHLIKGAALDVFAREPEVPRACLDNPDVIVTPHIASATCETRKKMAEIVIANLQAFLEHRPYLTPLKL